MTEDYDSEADTLRHIMEVRDLLSLTDIVPDPRLLGLRPGQPLPAFAEVPQMLPMPKPGGSCWIPGPDGSPTRFRVLRSMCRINGPKDKMILFVEPDGAAA